jgi:hypothetical protein
VAFLVVAKFAKKLRKMQKKLCIHSKETFLHAINVFPKYYEIKIACQLFREQNGCWVISNTHCLKKFFFVKRQNERKKFCTDLKIGHSHISYVHIAYIGQNLNKSFSDLIFISS